jgi:hypothetical protein
MNTVEQKITIQNLVNIIDRTVLQLRRVKKGDEFSEKLKNQIVNIINFTIESNTETFTNALFNKGVFIEKESLEIFHKNLNELEFSKEDLEAIAANVIKLDNKCIDEILIIQSTLVKISIPIWETIQELKNG